VPDDLHILVGRPGWAVEATTAVYAPTDTGWRARIATIMEPGRAYSRYHVAVIDPTGVARYTSLASTVVEAMRLAERQVNGRDTPNP
jgi:hypothetical protein